jgi:predicted transposase YbfD/YdcC
MNNIISVEGDNGFIFEVGRLYEKLGALSDKRQPKGKRYPLAVVLLLLLLAKLAGQDRPSGIAQWVELRRRQLIATLNLKRPTVPCHNTYRRVMQEAVDVAELQTMVTAFLTQEPADGKSILVAVDGKTLRGTIPTGESHGVHLLAAYLPAEGLVLMQVAVDGKENEIVAAPRLLEAIDLRDKIVCGDAILTQRKLSVQILEAGGDYLWLAKDNQPALLADIQEVFDPAPTAAGWSQAPRELRTAQTVELGHGRLEKRILTATTFLNDYSDWPGLAQVFRLERQVVLTSTGEIHQEVVFGLTSLSPLKATARQLLDYIRNYWGIENGLHYRRDKTLQEDATRMKHPHQAEVMAVLNNFIVGFSRQFGFENLAEARRFFDAKLNEMLISVRLH